MLFAAFLVGGAWAVLMTMGIWRPPPPPAAPASTLARIGRVVAVLGDTMLGDAVGERPDGAAALHRTASGEGGEATAGPPIR